MRNLFAGEHTYQIRHVSRSYTRNGTEILPKISAGGKFTLEKLVLPLARCSYREYKLHVMDPMDSLCSSLVGCSTYQIVLQDEFFGQCG